MSSDKLNIVKNFKFTPEVLQIFEQTLKGLHEKPIETEQLPNGEVKVSNEYQLQKLIDIGLLSLEMNIASMKHSLALHLEHSLTDEIKEEEMAKMEYMMKGVMKGLGLGKDKLGSDRFGTNMFGGNI